MRPWLPALLMVATAAIPLRAAEIQPHEAVYDVSVKTWKMQGDIAEFSGAQTIRIEEGCTDWVLIARMTATARTGDGRTIQFENELNGLEAKDGTRYRFRSETRIKGQPAYPVAGVATRPAPDRPGVVALSEPAEQKIPLPRETLFPFQATHWTLGQWANGETKANYVLFNGSAPEPHRVFELRTKTSPPEVAPRGDAHLVDDTVWRTSGSFHTYGGSQSGEPLTTLTQNVLANGIATALTVDIGFADIEARLSEIRALPAPSC